VIIAALQSGSVAEIDMVLAETGLARCAYIIRSASP
jgi:hypothetical protein